MDTNEAIRIVFERAAWFGMERQDDKELNDAVHELALAGREIDANVLFEWATLALQQNPPGVNYTVTGRHAIQGEEDHLVVASPGTQLALVHGIRQWMHFLLGLESEAQRNEVGPLMPVEPRKPSNGV